MGVRTEGFESYGVGADVGGGVAEEVELDEFRGCERSAGDGV